MVETIGPKTTFSTSPSILPPQGRVNFSPEVSSTNRVSFQTVGTSNTETFNRPKITEARAINLAPRPAPETTVTRYNFVGKAPERAPEKPKVPEPTSRVDRALFRIGRAGNGKVGRLLTGGVLALGMIGPPATHELASRAGGIKEISIAKAELPKTEIKVAIKEVPAPKHKVLEVKREIPRLVTLARNDTEKKTPDQIQTLKVQALAEKAGIRVEVINKAVQVMSERKVGAIRQVKEKEKEPWELERDELAYEAREKEVKEVVEKLFLEVGHDQVIEGSDVAKRLATESQKKQLRSRHPVLMMFKNIADGSWSKDVEKISELGKLKGAKEALRKSMEILEKYIPVKISRKAERVRAGREDERLVTSGKKDQIVRLESMSIALKAMNHPGMATL